MVINRSFSRLALIAGISLIGVAAHAQSSLAWWNFNSGTVVPTSMDATVRGNLFSADGGVNVGSASMITSLITFTDGTTGSPRGISTFTGTTVNAQGGDTAVNDLAITGQGDGTNTGTPNNGGELIFGVSTVGYSGINVSWANRVTASGFQNSQFAYSSDGGANWTDFGAAFGGTTTFTLKTVDLSSISAIDNNANTLFRIKFNGATAANGNARLDNLLIQGTALAAVPEPGSIALLGLAALPGVALLRRRK